MPENIAAFFKCIVSAALIFYGIIYIHPIT